MHKHDLRYDPADVPIPVIMLKALREKIESTSTAFVVRNGPFTQREIHTLLKSNGQDIHWSLLHGLKHWYMITRPQLPVYKQRKKFVRHHVTKTQMKRAVGMLRQYIFQTPDSLEGRAIDVTQELHKIFPIQVT